MKKLRLLIIYLFIILSVCYGSVISSDSATDEKRSDDAFVIEPQPFQNSTEAVELEDDEDLYLEDVPIRYDGAQLLRIAYDDQKKRNIVAELQETFEVEMWNVHQNFTSVDLLIKKPIVIGVKQFLDENKVPYEVLIENLQRAIDTENPPQEEIEQLQNRKARKTGYYWGSPYYRRPPRLQQRYYFQQPKGAYLHGYNSLDPPLMDPYYRHGSYRGNRGHRLTWSAYHRLIDIYGYLDYLAKSYEDLCSVQSIGQSVQGRPLKVLRISNGNPSNKAIWIDGGIHAREWISPASVTYVINNIIENWEDQPSYIQNIDWYILPVANPDGYEYTHDVDRLWRKNRGGTGLGRCAGVDLNRNFGYRWGGQGASRQPCAETFAGTGAFSEPETSALRDFMSISAANFAGWLTFHSYGQFLLYPWGYDRTVPPDHMDLDRVAREAAMKIQSVHGTTYKYGPSGSLLYPASGASDDWAKGSLGIKYSYTIELRDGGRHGFILPASLIEVTAKEAMIFVSTVASAVRDLP